MDLRKIANAVISEVMDSTEESSCSLDIEKCRSKKGPTHCRYHCKRYMDLLAESKTFQEAAWILYNNFGVRVGSRDAISALGISGKFERYILDLTHPISADDYVKTTQAYCAVLRDLRERFPNLRLPHSIMIAAESNTGGFSTLDSINVGKPCIVLNVCHDYSAYNGFSFGHADSRLKYDMIRHEVGHTIMTYGILKSWYEEIKNVCQTKGIAAFRRDMEKISQYAACEDDNQPYESFAEAFSKFTSHDYKTGDLPGWVENFIQKVATTGIMK